MNAQEIVEIKCREIYAEAQDFFDRNRCDPYYGFKILYGPPFYNPPILFVGYQPGGADNDFERETDLGSDKHWRDECEYANESWNLAVQMQRMFGRQLLKRCVGINAIFLRAPSADRYKSSIKRTLREQIESFCVARVIRLVEAIEPEKIVAIGFDTLKLFGESVPDITSDEGRVLTRVGTLAGRLTIATLHLSGARISKPDRARIQSRVLGA